MSDCISDHLSDSNAPPTPVAGRPPWKVTVDPTEAPRAARGRMLLLLRQGRLPGKFLYQSPAQARHWLAYHEACSPSRQAAPVRGLYAAAMTAAVQELAGQPLVYVGLGCGGGQKDRLFLDQWQAQAIQVARSAQAAQAAQTARATPVAQATHAAQTAQTSLPPSGLPSLFPTAQATVPQSTMPQSTVPQATAHQDAVHQDAAHQDHQASTAQATVPRTTAEQHSTTQAVHQDAAAQVSVGSSLAETASRGGSTARLPPLYVPLDASEPLVLAAAARVAAGHPSISIHPLVADLTAKPDLRPWLSELPAADERARVFTCFGMLPNLEPLSFPRYLAALLAPGDRLLVSANLSPGSYEHSRGLILKQYDHPLARAWYAGALGELGLAESAAPIVVYTEALATLAQDGSVWRIVAETTLTREAEVALGGEVVSLAKGQRLEVFQSLRFTLPAARRLLENAGLAVSRTWCDPTGEEGLLLCRPGNT